MNENKKLSEIAKANLAKYGARPYNESFVQQMRDKIIKERVRLIFKQPFYGQLLLNFSLEIVGDENHHIKTCAIDGRKIYFNPEYANDLTPDEILYAIAFLLLRVVFHQVTRRGSRDKDSWFAAGAYVNNGILNRDGIGKMPTTKRQDDENGKSQSQGIKPLLDSKHDGKSTDQVYLTLMDEGGNDGSNQFDQSLDAQESGFDDDDILDIENNMDAAIQSAAAGAGVGKVPGEVQRWIDELNEPKLNWREFLHENATSRIKSDYTWRRPNRRMQGVFPNIIFPSQKIESSIKFVLGIDMSGSISDEMAKDMLSEVAGVANHFKDFEVMVMCWDTVVYPQSVKTFTPENLHEIYEYKPYGGGGTNPAVCWDYLKEKDIKPDMFVQFTDGCIGGVWGDEEYCDTFWIIHDKYMISEKVKAPFGQTLYYHFD